ncbi:MAG: tRNA uracil 4-sulfurtransferase ThiI [Candidatus Woesearchaeota archaeon]
MENSVVVRFAELTLKGKNRNFFEKKLIEDIQLHLKIENINSKIVKDRSRLYLFSDSKEDIDKIVDVLFYVSGIKSISKAIVCDKDINKISENVYKLIAEKNYTDKVMNLEVKRSDKSFPLKSPEISKEIINHLSKINNQLKFSYENYDLTIFVEIQQKFAFVFDNKVACLSGLPRKTTGKGLVLLSGGMDSPVAAVFSIKRGLSVDAIFFDVYNDEKYREKMSLLVKALRRFDPELKYYLNPFYKFHKFVYENISSKNLKYGCIICKRGMFYLAEKLLKEKKYDVLITGENIGQVASQTISNMKTIYSQRDALILSPLLMFDKEEIENYAKFFRIHELINIKHEGRCLLLADYPVTYSNNSEIERIEKELNVRDFLDILYEETKIY